MGKFPRKDSSEPKTSDSQPPGAPPCSFADGSGHWSEGLLVVGATAFLLVVLCTISSIDNPFILDDIPKVQDNPDVRNLWKLSSTLVYPYEDTHGAQHARNDPSRPITFLTYALNYCLFGPSPRSFRKAFLAFRSCLQLSSTSCQPGLCNICIHWLNSVALYCLLGRMWGCHNQVLSWTCYLFACTPINIGTTTYIYGRSDILSALFTLMTLLTDSAISDTSASRPGWNGTAVAMLLGLMYAVSLGCKQTCLSTPILSFLQHSWHRVSSLQVNGTRLQDSSRWTLRAVIYSSVSVAYIAFRFQILGGFGDLEASDGVHPWLGYAAVQPLVILRYLRILLFATGLALDHEVMPAEDLFDRELIVSVLLLVGLATGYVGLCLTFLKGESMRLLLWCFAFFFLCLAPSSSLLPTVDCMVERRMYLASVGPIMAILYVYWGFMHSMFSRPWVRISGSIPLVCVTAGYVHVNLNRNTVFRDHESTWTDVLQQYPTSVRALNNLGTMYMQRKGSRNLQIATGYFDRLIKGNPKDEYALNNLGTIHNDPTADDGSIEEKLYRPEVAAHLFRRAIKANPKFAAPNYNLGLYHHRKAQAAAQTGSGPLSPEEDKILSRAEKLYRRAIEIWDKYALARNNMGLIHYRRGEYSEAEKQYQKVLLYEPNHSAAIYNMELLEKPRPRGVTGASGVPEGATRVPHDHLSPAVLLDLFSNALKEDPNNQIIREKALKLCKQTAKPCTRFLR